MLEIPGGTFMMGDARGEKDQKPAHKVTVTTFCLDVTEVTVGAYDACQACSHPGGPALSRFCNWNRSNAARHPVNCVTWEQARRYCESMHKSLPTEAQWEYAARGGDQQRKYPWGDAPPSQELVCWDRNYEGPPGTCPSGSKPEEAFGLRDMGGNVNEWVADWYGVYPSGDAHDRHGPAEGTERVLRGGAWPMNMPSGVVVAWRTKHDPDQAYPTLGFRCARSLNSRTQASSPALP